ncbi:MAG: glycosyltransferase [Thermodesulfobacteriota bacterium]|nr:glycosyltransferase [Thermodesulfobacteriota bacterium]
MISVIIPSYNSENTISKCLDSLEDQSYTGDFEIIVVDSSHDRTSEIISTNYPEVKLTHLNKRTDPGTARNIGIGQATWDLIAFLDSDCVPARDWVERIVSAHAHESSCHIIGGIVKNGSDRDDPVGCAGYMAEFRDFLPRKDKQEVTHIPTCNVSYKKRIFRDFGLFQGKYYPQEDLIFNYNLWNQGESILLDPAIQVWHHHRSRLKDFLYHQNRIGRATSRVLRTIPLQGSFIARCSLLATCLLPFITLVKFVKTIRIFLRCQPGFIKECPLVLPVFALGLVCWAIGFVGSL